MKATERSAARPTVPGPTRRRGGTPRVVLRSALAVLFATLGAGGCGGPPPPAVPAPSELASASWEELARPRPEPLEDAPRISVAAFEVAVPDRGSDLPGDLGIETALQEMISVGLLRRRDVEFVERRRFIRAVRQVQQGRARPEGAPPVGRTPGAELVLEGRWEPARPDSVVLELRLTDARTGEERRAWRTAAPARADLPSLARAATGGLLRALSALDRLPEWDDPLEARGIEAAPPRYRDAAVPAGAMDAFLRGLEAEDRYAWQRARRDYLEAIEEGEPPVFFEAREALARTARLRTGGTLGESP